MIRNPCSRSVPLLLLLFIFIASCGVATASNCTAVSQGDLTSCYALRQWCRYSPPVDACIDGKPVGCSQSVSDTTGCNAQVNCTMSTSGYCIDKPPACSTLSGNTLACSVRSDCSVKNTTCITGSFGCGNYTSNAALCIASFCFYDNYLTQCFNSLGEVQGLHPCSTWTTFSPTACSFHGCFWNSGSAVCQDPGSGAQNATIASSTLDVKFVNPRVLANTLTFQLDVWVANILPFNPSFFTYIGFGGGIAGFSTFGGIKSSSLCNDIGASYNVSKPPPQFFDVSDPVGLQNYFNSWVSTGHNMTFGTTGNPFNSQLTTVLGDIRVGSTSFDSSVSLDATNNWVIHTISTDLNQAITNCSIYGTSLLLTSGIRYYRLPVFVMQRDYLNHYIQSATSFSVQVLTSGNITVGSTSQYALNVFQWEITSITQGCPAGQAYLNIVYLIEIDNVFDGSYVGPRNASDIFFTTPAVNNTIQNCYGEVGSISNFQRSGCSGSSCFVSFTSQTNCRVVTADGNAFNNCSYALAADRIADMGATAQYPAALNMVHTFWTNTYKCPQSAKNTTGWANCTLVNQSPTGLPDQYTSTIHVDVFPRQQVSVTYDIFAGLLPTPLTTDQSQIETLTTAYGSVITSQTVDLQQTQLTWDASLTFIVGMLAPTMRTLASLTITIDTSFSIVPLDTHGNQISGGKVLHWNDVFLYMSYVPDGAPGVYCTTCLVLPITVNTSGIDGFSIPVQTLRTLSPANGYQINVDYSFDLGTPQQTSRNGLLSLPMHMMSRIEHSPKRVFKAMVTPSDTVQSVANAVTEQSIENESSSDANANAADADEEWEDANGNDEYDDDADSSSNRRKLLQASLPSTQSTVYAFSLFIDDTGNPDLILDYTNVTITNTTTNSSDVVEAAQLTMVLYVLQSDGNETNDIAYILAHAPAAFLQAFPTMWPQQISRISVIPSTAVTILQPGETAGTPPSAAYKVTFVGAPKPSQVGAMFRMIITALQTAQEVMIMEVALIQHGLQMMHTSTYKVIFIIIPTPAWYTLPLLSIGTPITTTPHSGVWYGLDLWVLIVVSFAVFAFLATPFILIVYRRMKEGRWGFYSLIQRTKHATP